MCVYIYIYSERDRYDCMCIRGDLLPGRGKSQNNYYRGATLTCIICIYIYIERERDIYIYIYVEREREKGRRGSQRRGSWWNSGDRAPAQVRANSEASILQAMSEACIQRFYGFSNSARFAMTVPLYNDPLCPFRIDCADSCYREWVMLLQARLSSEGIGPFAWPSNRKTDCSKQCVGQNGKTGSGKHNRTSAMSNGETAKRRNGKRPKRTGQPC